MNNFIDNARTFESGKHCIQKHLYEHFNLPRHSGFLNNVSVKHIDKTDPMRPTKLGIPIVYARGVWRLIYVIFNTYNFRITFFIALS